MGEAIWLRTDYRTEGTQALEMAVEQLKRVRDDPYRWKWSVIAVHNALQAFMVYALSATDHLGAMTDGYAKHWHEQRERGEAPTRPEKLAAFPELFKRLKGIRGYVNSAPLQPTEEQEQAVRALNDWRNEFMHYTPKSMSIEISGYPEIVTLNLEIIDSLAFESQHVFRREDQWAIRSRNALEQANLHLGDVVSAYQSRG